MQTRTILSAVLTVAGIFLVSMAVQGIPKACATGIAPSTCDTNVWQTMVDRARLETEREIMQNQNLIFKADSILNYVCFDSFARHASTTLGPLFTTTSYFGTTVLPADAMMNAVNNVVLGALGPYIGGNFNHDYLGGRGSELPNQSLSPVAATGTTYVCGDMGKVWAVAKCLNFMHNAAFAETDGFYPFKDIPGYEGSPEIVGYETKNDVRNWPTPCNGPSLGNDWWKGTADSSENLNESYPFATPNQEHFQQVRARLSTAVACSAPIPTGVTIILSPGSPTGLADAVCTNGCSYNGTACTRGGGDGSGVDSGIDGPQ